MLAAPQEPRTVIVMIQDLNGFESFASVLCVSKHGLSRFALLGRTAVFIMCVCVCGHVVFRRRSVRSSVVLSTSAPLIFRASASAVRGALRIAH
eukprot:5507743-Alexandrium_andersonii.AAC.1